MLRLSFRFIFILCSKNTGLNVLHLHCKAEQGCIDLIRSSVTRQENYSLDADGLVELMQVAHDGFVQAIRSTQFERAYIRGTKGIVSSAGGKYLLPTFIIFLRLLRGTGARLPVELFMKDWTGTNRTYVR